MIRRYLYFTFALFALGACSTTTNPINPSIGYKTSKPISCVHYARDVVQLPIYGDANTWWHQAKGRYERSQTPRENAIFVLAKSSRLKYGHLSVVNRIINPRTIEVEHSNWGNTTAKRSFVYKNMRVQDLSPHNDWTRVRFWNYHIDSWGLPYVASGFIYPA